MITRHSPAPGQRWTFPDPGPAPVGTRLGGGRHRRMRSHKTHSKNNLQWTKRARHTQGGPAPSPSDHGEDPKKKPDTFSFPRLVPNASPAAQRNSFRLNRQCHSVLILFPSRDPMGRADRRDELTESRPLRAV
jgi:hypothetical protein